MDEIGATQQPSLQEAATALFDELDKHDPAMQRSRTLMDEGDALLAGDDTYGGADDRPHVHVVDDIPLAKRSSKSAHNTGPAKKDKKRKKEIKQNQQPTAFDQAMARIKRNKKKTQISEGEASKRAQDLLQEMRDAYDKDVENLAQAKPATAKLSLIDRAQSEILKPVWTSWFLTEGLITVVAQWLQPGAGGTLPNLTIRTKVLKMLAAAPITADNLLGTNLGEILIELWKHQEETEENRKLIRKIVNQIMRSFGQPTAHRDESNRVSVK